MTKFEEEFKALTSWDWVNVDLIQKILTKFGNWHSDEEFQELKEEYSNQADSILLMLEEIANLKSQLQQQALPKTVEDFQGELEDLIDDILDDDISDSAFDGKKYKFIEKYAPQALPVVPECVAEFVSGDETELSKADRIAYLLKSVEGDNYYLEEYLTNAGIISQEQGEHLYAWATNQTHETILKLWNGYTVEKPQLFKLIFPNSTADLQKDGELNSFADTVYKRYLIENAMTEQEIKSIDERYWQFAVPVEDGE